MVNTTTSDVLPHDPFVIVHRSVTLVPAVTPVTVVLNDAVLVIVAEPASIVHKPVPGAGAFPARVNVEVLHRVLSEPASATGGVARFVSTTSSKAVHAPFVTVQRKVTLAPALSPVTVLVGEVSSVMVAPLGGVTNVH